MKTMHMLMMPMVLTGGLSTAAFANDGSLTPSELESLLNDADAYGVTHYDEIAIDDNNRLEVEGWRDDGWQLDIDMLVKDGSLVHEKRHQDTIPDWSLNSAELRQALDNARDAGMKRFAELDVDGRGHVDIEGYDTQNSELDLRLERDGLTITGVEHD
ncbi:YpeB-like protein with putative protease inhibitory function [Chromohalobacter marismortui]|uniref:YpeB-like protein with putative protease inhibitory function n=1 Tax=Chromohalobacter marismortui TaxID=42055 RepID=A0A4V3F5F3_9GAMM|nr:MULTISPECIES: PepSY domain-containing protein [Chromohalobacter]MCI0509122.1 PepSY domain-containing protein [Chromohalobacter sp.]MCI0592789.1 PepSY domain-containing protein [Chromohalobacter sp.]TDU23986.1 YpeB-like protein with putative protease inhibitory function [Chromohalobacter marismortui]